MINRRHFSLAAGAAALASWSSVQSQTANRIVLGQSAAFTGPAAQLGIQFHAGAKLWFEQVNDNGGINGRRIEIKKLDDGYEPERCLANTKQLIDEGVFALFGYIGTPTSLAALPVIKSSQIPFIAPFTGAMSLRDPFAKNVFHLRASYNDETALIVKQLTNLGLKKIAVFYQNDAYGKAGLER
jgi:branched-chain amino acid transport system substrate-binding protein